MSIHKLGKHLLHHQIEEYMNQNSEINPNSEYDALRKELRDTVQLIQPVVRALAENLPHRSVLQYSTKDVNSENFYNFTTENNYLVVPFVKANLLKIEPKKNIEALFVNSKLQILPAVVEEGDKIQIKAKIPVKRYIYMDFVFEM